MYTTSRVIKTVDPQTVLVGCSTDACKACKAEMFCNTKDDTSFLVKKEKSLEVKEGDMVELYMPGGKTVASVSLVFALPLLLFPVGYLLMKKFTEANELINALAGLGAMAIAFCIVSLISIKHKRDLMPEITKIIKLEANND